MSLFFVKALSIGVLWCQASMNCDVILTDCPQSISQGAHVFSHCRQVDYYSLITGWVSWHYVQGLCKNIDKTLHSISVEHGWHIMCLMNTSNMFKYAWHNLVCYRLLVVNPNLKKNICNYICKFVLDNNRHLLTIDTAICYSQKHPTLCGKFCYTTRVASIQPFV